MSQEIKKIVDEMRNDMQKEIASMQEKIVLLENFDENAAVTPEQFQLLCNTPLRGTKLLEKIVQNTFPMATEIHTSLNYIHFTLYDVPCMLPTWVCKNAVVDMSWWKNDKRFNSDTKMHMAKELVEKVYPILQQYSGAVMQSVKNRNFCELDIESFKQEWESSELYQEVIAEQEERE